MENLEIIEQESLTTLDRARALVVNTPEQYSIAGEFIVGCKALIAKIKQDFAEPKKKADEAHKAITAMEWNALYPVQQAIEVVSGTAMEWKRDQDRIAKEEKDRLEGEKRRRLEESRLKEAEVLEQWGETKAAARKLEQAVMPPRQTKFESPVPKVAGLSTRKKWKAKIIDPSAVKREYCEPDATRINAKVASYFAHVTDATNEQIAKLTAEIGGVEIYEDEIFAGKTRRA